ncbi:unnamed protein product [Polarella glacialis]|uniref:Sushi domain-containing protein n=1 Tax=Polarella glacialis TaxID=89957 RepID=A0A813FP08_POLGL|nr:unnamed protein product [Polarella glacialis]
MNTSSEGSIAQQGAEWYICCAAGFNSSIGTASVKLVCSEGNWLGLESIPECNADCPLYILHEGYEVEKGSEALAKFTATQMSPAEGSMASAPGNLAGAVQSPNARALEQNSSGVPHRISIGIQCVDGYGRMPGAVEHVQCNDGQWSPLSLVCQKDCLSFNVSSSVHTSSHVPKH